MQEEFDEDLIPIEESFKPLVLKCKELGRAMRIGTNHGSLSARVLSYYGDTPRGMVESAVEFANICRCVGPAWISQHYYCFAPALPKIRELCAVLGCSDIRTFLFMFRSHSPLYHLSMYIHSTIYVTRVLNLFFSKHDFHNFVFSMKASNPLVMVQAYRLLAAEQYR